MQQIKKEAVMRGFALALAFLGVAATAEAASAAPAVTLSTTGNHPQGPVGVTGSGFGPGETVTFTFDTTQVLSLQADGTGAFSGKSLTVPTAAQPGTHTISAVGATTGDTVTSKFLVITNWSEEGYGPEHTGSNPYENTLSAANAADLNSTWNSLPPVFATSPAILGAGRLFFGAYKTHGTSKVYGLAKVQAATGYLAWIVQLGSSPTNTISASPAIDNDVVYAGAFDNKLYAINAETGKILWSSATGALNEGIYGAPIVIRNLIYVGSKDGNVYALNRSNGSVVWNFLTGGGRVWSPAVVNGVVYVTTESNAAGSSYTYALNAQTGVKLWSFVVTGDVILTSPKFSDNVVYIGSYKGMLYALSANTGTPLWTRSFGSGILDVSFSQLLYAMVENGSINALDTRSGLSVWQATVPSGAAALSVENGVVYVSAGNANLYSFDAVKGTLLGSTNIGYYGLPGGIIVANGQVYVTGEGSTIALFPATH